MKSCYELREEKGLMWIGIGDKELEIMKLFDDLEDFSDDLKLEVKAILGR